MAQALNGLKRTKYCGLFGEEQLNSKVIAMGWVAKKRSFGNLVFVDLRDRTGIVQVVFNGDDYKNDYAKVESLKNEYCICIKGVLKVRSNVNDKIATGKYEIVADDLLLLSESDILPFNIDEADKVNESLKLKYRYLDLRRNELQKNIIIRSKIAKVVRDYLDKNNFIEIETPCLGRSTPEGARDYLVPSRTFPGNFFALPQSPQLYKQLLMIGGFDRYYQIARCFRDEDLRSDRQPEFTQVDIEMSFADKEWQVMEVVEGLIIELWDKIKNEKLPTPFRKMTYAEALERFGSDKPDTRFGLEIKDITSIAKNSTFSAYIDCTANGGTVRCINAKGLASKMSRKEIDAISELAKSAGTKGLTTLIYDEEGIRGSVAKYFDSKQIEEISKITELEKGDILLLVADANEELVCETLGKVRLYIGKKFELIDNSKTDVLWVVDFPLFEYNKEEQRFEAKHHPFTSPKDEDFHLLETNRGKMRAKAYDIVINGYEAGGGSIRIFNNKIQEAMFKALGFTKEKIEQNFGFFVNAFKYGTPPHGGLALGLDRLTMLLTDTNDIRSVIAFPKVQTAADLMNEAPAIVTQKQLDELGIELAKKSTNK